MSIESRRQLENTRAKLLQLEQRLATLAGQPASNPAAREATRHSLQKLANQLREEIARFEAHLPTPTESTGG